MLAELRNRIGLGLAAIGCALFLVPLSFLSSISYVDALEHYGWLDGTAVTDAVPGQFYVVDEIGKVREPLCSLQAADFAPRENASNGIRFRNVLGHALPGFLLAFVSTDARADDQIVAMSAPHELEWRAFRREFVTRDSLLFHNRRLFEERDLNEIAKQATAREFDEAVRLESCATAIITALDAGFSVCQLSEVVRNDSTDTVLAVDFASLCLTRGQGDAQRFPDNGPRSLWVEARKSLGLVEAAPL